MKPVNHFPAKWENLVNFDGDLYLLPGFYPSCTANDYYNRLTASLAWQTEKLHIHGRWVEAPRLMAWYGDLGVTYRYSGLEHLPNPWTTELAQLRADMAAVCKQRFNSVMANLYRHGQDSMGCHADNEKELGLNPTIASLSFGESRLLRFKHALSGAKLDVELANGDLLIMAGKLQENWRHELPKTRKIKQARINLTFRLNLHD